MVLYDVAVAYASRALAVRNLVGQSVDQLAHRHQTSRSENSRVFLDTCPAFVCYLRLPLRREVIRLLANHGEHVRFPALQRRVLDQERQHVALRLLGKLLLLCPLVLELLALLVEEGLRVDEVRHVLAVRLEPANLDRLLDHLVAALGGKVRRVLIDQVLQREAPVDERLHRLDTHLVDDAAKPGGVVRHLVHHLPVGVLERVVVLEEVDVAVDVGHHQLLVHVHVGLEQVRVRGIVVDHHLVDLREPVLVSLGELLVLHPEPPVRVAVGEAAVGGHHVDLVVAEDLEDGLVEVEPEPLRVPLDLALDVTQVRWKAGVLVLVH